MRDLEAAGLGLLDEAHNWKCRIQKNNVTESNLALMSDYLQHFLEFRFCMDLYGIIASGIRHFQLRRRGGRVGAGPGAGYTGRPRRKRRAARNGAAAVRAGGTSVPLSVPSLLRRTAAMPAAGQISD